MKTFRTLQQPVLGKKQIGRRKEREREIMAPSWLIEVDMPPIQAFYKKKKALYWGLTSITIDPQPNPFWLKSNTMLYYKIIIF